LTEHDDILYLTHIDRMASSIERTIMARGRSSLDIDFELRDATMYRLQTLAESTQQLSTAFKEAHPDIPWNDIASFRHRVVHGYLTIDLDIVWDIIERDIPPLAECVRTALEVNREREERERDTGLDIDL